MEDNRTKEKTARRLEGLELDAVAFVSAGAQMRDFFIRKSKEQSAMDEKILKQVIEIEAEGETEMMEAFRRSHADASDEACDATCKAYRMLSAYAESMPEGAIDAFVKSVDGTAAGAIATLAEIEKGKLKWVAQQLGLTEEQLKSAIESAKAERPEEDERPKKRKSLFNGDGSVNEEIAKSYPEDVREEMVALAKAKAEQDRKLAEIEKARAAEQDAKRLQECIAKAAPYRVIGAVPEDLGATMKAMEEKLEKSAVESLYGLFDRLVTLVEKSDVLMKEIGRASAEPEDESPYAQLKKAAEEIQKAEPALTPEQAFARAAKARKDLTSAHFSRR